MAYGLEVNRYCSKLKPIKPEFPGKVSTSVKFILNFVQGTAMVQVKLYDLLQLDLDQKHLSEKKYS